jgi:voltage-gated potassium channel
MKLKNEWYKISLAFAFVVISLVIGVAGFIVLGHYSFIDAVYMSVITLSTVGYTEPKPLDDGAKIFVVFYLIINLGVFTYFLAVVTDYLVNGRLKEIFKTYKNTMDIGKKNNHVVVCGLGRMGEKAVEELERNEIEFVAIEKKSQLIISHQKRYKSISIIEGNAVEDDILKEAGVERASAILITLPNDADNVFIALTAKELNPKIKVISRASEESSVTKLKRAGADHVIMPYAIGGIHMASLISKPAVIEFLDLMNGMEDENYLLEELHYNELKEEFKDKSLSQLEFQKFGNVVTVGIKNKQKKFDLNPKGHTQINLNDVLIIFGTSSDLKKMKEHYCR